MVGDKIRKSAIFMINPQIAHLKSPPIANPQLFQQRTERMKHLLYIKRSAPFGPFIAEPPKIRLQVCSAEFFIYDKFKFENFKPYLQGENNLFADFRKF